MGNPSSGWTSSYHHLTAVYMHLQPIGPDHAPGKHSRKGHMKADALNPRELFWTTVHYEIPAFQRPYVWTLEDQLQPLWLNVRDVVGEPRTGQHRQHLGLLVGSERVRRRGPPCPGGDRCWVLGPVVTGPGATQQGARAHEPDALREGLDHRVDHRGDRFGGSALSESVSKSACAFATRSHAALV